MPPKKIQQEDSESEIFDISLSQDSVDPEEQQEQQKQRRKKLELLQQLEDASVEEQEQKKRSKKILKVIETQTVSVLGGAKENMMNAEKAINEKYDEFTIKYAKCQDRIAKMWAEIEGEEAKIVELVRKQRLLEVLEKSGKARHSALVRSRGALEVYKEIIERLENSEDIIPTAA